MSKNKTAAVLGFGVTGRALLDFLLQNPTCREKYDKIFLYNDYPIKDKEKMQFYQARGVKFLSGREKFAGLEQAGVIILSPGINSRDSRFDSIRKKGGEILSEIEFSSRFFHARVVSVTGTNGKSTTVSLLHHILKENGFNSLLLGNIGKPLISEVDNISKDAIVVLELSSFQLEEIVEFKSHIALLLNVTPDHLDRYSSPADYFSAKQNIFKNQDEKDYMVLNRDDPLIKAKVFDFGPGIQTWFSMSGSEMKGRGGAYLENDAIVLKTRARIKRISLKNNPLRGLHNLQNILAAVTAAAILKVDVKGIEAGIASFKGLPHRMEAAGKVGPVEFINDSKATNVDAALKSISSINGELVLILGGKDKGGDFELLETPIKKKANKVLLVGAAAETIYDQLPHSKEKIIFVKDFAEAVPVGYSHLKESGGTVLLAPGCASFDMFDNFEHRGEVFKQEVRTLQEKIAHG
ncbi:MAG: UDP-N-acetylmuramoyl-L-alanine--D-glutamate ligase [Candidatus Aminicenantes bacterium]|nr:UDP-N-acetylmuramoyl-L-alanine--D-glutamate ligase [Candidatus Aminicenantes bacterium]